MLQLEHLNLVVRDMQQTLAFYRAAFPHWKVRAEGEGNWYGTQRNWIHFGDDYQFLSFNDKGTGENRDLETNRLGLSHFAFVTQNLQSLVARLENAGFTPTQSGGDGNYRKNRYFIDPNGYEVEFVQYLTDIPEQRNSMDN